MAAERGIEVSRIYMIGDNPTSDIGGANLKAKFNSENGKVEWKSIVVKTGVYNDTLNSNNASYIVYNLEKAFELIC